MLKLDEHGPQGASSATGDAFARLLGGFFQTELRCPRCSKEWSKAEDFFPSDSLAPWQRAGIFLGIFERGFHGISPTQMANYS